MFYKILWAIIFIGACFAVYDKYFAEKPEKVSMQEICGDDLTPVWKTEKIVVCE